jgi:hypothetical protein
MMKMMMMMMMMMMTTTKILIIIAYKYESITIPDSKVARRVAGKYKTNV